MDCFDSNINCFNAQEIKDSITENQRSNYLLYYNSIVNLYRIIQEQL